MDKKPNILIITFDCLRPDHLSASGYCGVFTPAFDRVIAEGAFFENAYCQAPNTWISHASLFSGCNPYLHGVRSPVGKINPQIKLMAEVFQSAGYATFGLPAMSLLNPASGFSRGFDVFPLDGLVGTGKVVPHRYLRLMEDTLNRTIAWISEAPSPFFAWIHYFGIHKVDPVLLDLPPTFRAKYSPYAQHYDAKVAHADRNFLAPLLGHLERLGILNDTILVLWSDHGDDLHAIEHQINWGHNWDLSEQVMKTLLVMRGPEIPANQRVTNTVRSIDIFPTLLKIARIDPPSTIEGADVLHEGIPNDRFIYMENLCQGFLGVRSGPWKLTLSDNHLSPADPGTFSWRYRLVRQTLIKILPTRLKRYFRTQPELVEWWAVRGEPLDIYQRLLASGHPFLFNLEQDPEGKTNIYAKHPDQVATLKERLAQLASASPGRLSLDLDAAERQELIDRLKQLGYY